MPLVKIEILKGHSAEYKKTFLSAVHDALESALGAELTIYPGRSREIKGKIISEITRLLGERLDILPPDIFIVINDPPVENWGTGGFQRG